LPLGARKGAVLSVSSSLVFAYHEMAVHLMLDKPAGFLNSVGKKVENGADF
jgi:hypothetical protein